MARVFVLETAADDIRKNLARSFQSANVNFLIGSGASHPAIPTAGTAETEIAAMFEAGDHEAAYLKLYDFLSTIQAPTNSLISGASDPKNTATVANYTEFLGILETVLSERSTSLLPKQATIFTTNYDLFIEEAAVSHSAMRLNDGFSRVPNLTGRAEFSSRTFFTTTSSTVSFRQACVVTAQSYRERVLRRRGLGDRSRLTSSMEKARGSKSSPIQSSISSCLSSFGSRMASRRS